jgi:hypothetical protein
MGRCGQWAGLVGIHSLGGSVWSDLVSRGSPSPLSSRHQRWQWQRSSSHNSLGFSHGSSSPSPMVPRPHPQLARSSRTNPSPVSMEPACRRQPSPRRPVAATGVFGKRARIHTDDVVAGSRPPENQRRGAVALSLTGAMDGSPSPADVVLLCLSPCM